MGLSIHIAGKARRDIGSGPLCRGLDYQLLLGRVRSFTLEDDRLLLRNAAGMTIARLMRNRRAQ